MRSWRARLGNPVPLVEERAAHLGWAWHPAPEECSCHWPQGLDLGRKSRVQGQWLGTAWRDGGAGERTFFFFLSGMQRFDSGLVVGGWW